MKLVIVESRRSPKESAGFLGQGWRVEACLGHVRDLPEVELGVEVAADFRPTYEVLPGKGNIVKKLLKAIKDAEAVYVATDRIEETQLPGICSSWRMCRKISLCTGHCSTPLPKTQYAKQWLIRVRWM